MHTFCERASIVPTEDKKLIKWVLDIEYLVNLQFLVMFVALNC